MITKPKRFYKGDHGVLARALAEAKARRRLPPPGQRRQCRQQAGISQIAMANALGVTPAAISMWERGVRTPRGTLLGAYLRVLGRLKAVAV